MPRRARATATATAAAALLLPLLLLLWWGSARRSRRVCFGTGVFTRETAAAGLQHFSWTGGQSPTPSQVFGSRLPPFLFDCFPTLRLHERPDFYMRQMRSHFWWQPDADGGKLPAVLVSVGLESVQWRGAPCRVVSVFNGCVARPLRGLGLGPALMSRSVCAALDQLPPGMRMTVFSVLVRGNAHARSASRTYVRSGLAQFVFLSAKGTPFAELLDAAASPGAMTVSELLAEFSQDRAAFCRTRLWDLVLSRVGGPLELYFVSVRDWRPRAPGAAAAVCSAFCDSLLLVAQQAEREDV